MAEKQKAIWIITLQEFEWRGAVAAYPSREEAEKMMSRLHMPAEDYIVEEIPFSDNPPGWP